MFATNIIPIPLLPFINLFLLRPYCSALLHPLLQNINLLTTLVSLSVIVPVVKYTLIFLLLSICSWWNWCIWWPAATGPFPPGLRDPAHSLQTLTAAGPGSRSLTGQSRISSWNLWYWGKEFYVWETFWRIQTCKWRWPSMHNIILHKNKALEFHTKHYISVCQMIFKNSMSMFACVISLVTAQCGS